ncbi:MAG: hypothetical protein JSW72_03115 [Candidatus Bathyarchaeota archaeon]|nr:MAG: hypothetical protein JSW72_03115 [Candidatus Bathyarchaeota archaeon]
MTWQDRQLATEASKTTETAVLFTNQKCVVETSKGTLTLEITRDNQPRGYIFHGTAKLLIDAIVETGQGAIGKPVEKTVETPFIMLGQPDAPLKLNVAESDDFTRLGYTDQTAFKQEAERLLDRFFRDSTRRCGRVATQNDVEGCIFAFQEDTGELILLVANGAKLVYTAPDQVFVSKGHKTVLTQRGIVAVSRPGKHVLIANDCVHVDRTRRETA